MMSITSLKNHIDFITYRFPHNETESINSQIARFAKALNALETSDYLSENEKTQMTNKGANKFIRKRDDSNNDLALYKISDENGLTQYDFDMLSMPTKPARITFIYHNDLDGSAAAAIAQLAFKDSMMNNKNKKVEFIYYNYNTRRITQHVNSLKEDKANQYSYKICIVLDLNLVLEEISGLCSVYNKVIWIDHHLTSINTALNTIVPFKKNFEVIIDSRYSAAYLSYLVFNKWVEKNQGIKINQTLPTIISMMDTKMCYNSIPEYTKIKLSEQLLEELDGKQCRYTYNTDLMVIRKSDTSLVGKTVLLYNEEYKTVLFPIGYTCGMNFNQYMADMGGFEPYSPIWKRLFTDDDLVDHMIQKGEELKEIMMKKIEITWNEETVYKAVHGKHVIRAIMSANSSKFLASTEYHSQSVKMIIKYRSAYEVSLGVYSDDIYLKRANLGKFLSEVFVNNNSNSGGGHPGAAVINIATSTFDLLINSLKGQYGTMLQQNCPHINEIYKNTRWEVDTRSYRYDKTIEDAFRIVSSVILAKWEEYTIKTLQKG